MLWDITDLVPHVFKALVTCVKTNSPVEDGRSVNIEEKGAIFFCIYRTAAGYSNTAAYLRRSKQTISTAFHEVLPAPVVLHH